MSINTKAIIAIALGAAFWCGVLLYNPPADIKQAAVANDATRLIPQKHLYTPEELLKETNDERAKVGLPSLKIDENLNISAQLKADDMKANNYWGHVNPSTGAHGYEYIRKTEGNSCKLSGENLSHVINFGDPLMTWMNSKPHKEAILSSQYDTVGFGYVEVGQEIYYVQHFCDVR